MEKEQNNDLENEKKALAFLEGGYLKVPRFLMENLYARQSEEQAMYRLYLCLFMHCAFSNTIVVYKKVQFSLRRGELICNYHQLEVQTNIPYYTVRRLLSQLEQMGLIRCQRIQNGLRLYLYGYDAYTTSRRDRPSAEEKETLADRLAEEEKKYALGLMY